MTKSDTQTPDSVLTAVQEDGFIDVPMTREEAEAHAERIIATTDELRWLLLEASERKAHVASGYRTFEAYTAKCLDLPFDKTSLSRMLQWAKTERNVLNLLKSKHDVNSTSAPAQLPKLTWVVAEQLSKLPTAKQQLLAFEEAEGLKMHGYMSPGQYLMILKCMVKRMAPVPKKETVPASPPDTGRS